MKNFVLFCLFFCQFAFAGYIGNGGGGGGSSYTFSDSVVNSTGTVTLMNDSASPGNSKYYGTNGSGTLGYNSIPVIGSGTVGDFLVSNGSGGAQASNGQLTIHGTATFLYDNGAGASEACLGNTTRLTPVTGGGLIIGSGDLGVGKKWEIDGSGNMNFPGAIEMGYMFISPPSSVYNTATPVTVAAGAAGAVFSWLSGGDNTPNINSVEIVAQGGTTSTGDYFFFDRRFNFVNTGSGYTVVSSAGVAVTPDIVTGSYAAGIGTASSITGGVSGTVGANTMTQFVNFNNNSNSTGNTSETALATSYVFYMNGHLH